MYKLSEDKNKIKLIKHKFYYKSSKRNGEKVTFIYSLKQIVT